ncbi:YchJ family metal-binding protein [Flavobacterium sp. MFBS3-15]|uniref:YchJ family protein n=1 Tax=Flavobacterium sp. MFBS3-15 TaxID=2989816 RepID=UPI002236080E|nr:YchJ family metal-binding protein [Flavobacterium sp. MFBS3-15]MCW4469056.1 YchJ family metal-binding protein [Flavobacterium sp. MFBS3-15]
MNGQNCHCGSGIPFGHCCQPYISGQQNAPTAETLMRSRYSAYAVHDAGYLWETTAPKMRKYYSKSAILQWAKANHWVKLEILKATETTVEFKAYYLDSKLQAQVHHEKSVFINESGKWYYSDGTY